MEFKVTSSPHLPSSQHTAAIMRRVIYALLPGTAVATYFFGWGVLINIGLAIAFGLTLEAGVLALRNRPLRPTLSDYSTVVTAWLLGLALPQLAPWWLTLVGMLFAIVFAKQLYGGLGYNPFNPAMVGYVALLISFPAHMTTWLHPSSLMETPLSFGQAWQVIFSGHLPEGLSWDSLSAATPLDAVRTNLSMHHALPEIFANNPGFGVLSGVGWEWVSVAYALGGLGLLATRTIPWQTPLAMILGLSLPALLFHWYDPTQYASPIFHLFAGGALLGAFFIVTDPVSGATTPLGRLIFGAGVGITTYVIRTWGGYPDAVAFSVLLLNMNAPLIDYYTQPRVFGKGKGRDA